MKAVSTIDGSRRADTPHGTYQSRHPSWMTMIVSDVTSSESRRPKETGIRLMGN